MFIISDLQHAENPLALRLRRYLVSPEDGLGGGETISWMVGGKATPTAWNTAPAQPGAAARKRSLRPAWSMSVCTI
jgi:hypothetical protein